MWDKVFEELAPGFVPDAAALDRAAEALGFALPASYRDFCRSCGVGLAGGPFRVAVPPELGAGSSLLCRFADDDLDLEQFMALLFATQAFRLMSVRG